MRLIAKADERSVMDFSIDALVRAAMDGAYNVIHIDELVGEDRRVVLKHRGHAGDRDDRVVLQLDRDEYLRLSADLHRRSVVQEQGRGGVAVTLVGSEYFAQGGHQRERRAPQLQAGLVADAGVPVVYQLQVDSIGQESWVLLIGYSSVAQLDRWVAAKSRICVELAHRVDRAQGADGRDALERLWPVLDRAIELDDFDLDVWAASAGIPLGPPAV